MLAGEFVFWRKQQAIVEKVIALKEEKKQAEQEKKEVS